MTINAQIPRAVFSGTGTRGPFVLQDILGNPIRVRNDSLSLLTVKRYATVTTETGTTLVLDTDFTVDNTDVDDVEITLTMAQDVLASGQRLVVERQSNPAGVVDYAKGSNFSAPALSSAISVLTEQVQELERDANRSIRVGWTETLGHELPVAANRAGKLAMFAESTGYLTNSSLTEDGLSTLDGLSDEIATLAGISAEIEQVAAIDAEVVIVADAMEDVETVSDNIADVQAVAAALDSPGLVAALEVSSPGGSGPKSLGTLFRDIALVAATYAAMTSMSVAHGLEDNRVIITYDRATEGDGGFGFWRYDAGSSATADGGTVLAHDSLSGRFIRLFDDKISVKWFGAKGDAATDDRAAIVAAISAADAGDIVYFPDATSRYRVTSQITVTTSGLIFEGTGMRQATIHLSDHTFDVFYLDDAQNVTFRNMAFIANAQTGTNVYAINTKNGTVNNSGLQVRNLQTYGLVNTIQNSQNKAYFDNIEVYISKAVDGIPLHINGETTGGADRPGAQHIGRLLAENAIGSDGRAGILVTQSGAIMCDMVQLLATGNGVEFACGNGQACKSFSASQLEVDNCSGTAFKATPTGTGIVSNVKLAIPWFASSNKGIETSGYANAIQITGGFILDMDSHGADIATGNTYANLMMDNVVIAACGGDGVVLAAGVKRAAITNCNISSWGYFAANTGAAIRIGSGAGNGLRIIGNDLRDNGSALVDGSTGYENIIKDNLGHGPAASVMGRLTNIPIGSVAFGSLGTSSVHVAGTIYYSEIFVPASRTVTGVGVLNGATVGTDNLIVAIYKGAGGAAIATSALAGTLSAGANSFQLIPLTAAIILPPGKYYVAVQCDGTTATTRRITASTFQNFGGSATGTFGTLPSLTPPTSPGSAVGPIYYLYI